MGLDVVEVVMRCEEEFGVSVSDADAEAMRTVGDLYRLVCMGLGLEPLADHQLLAAVSAEGEGWRDRVAGYAERLRCTWSAISCRWERKRFARVRDSRMILEQIRGRCGALGEDGPSSTSLREAAQDGDVSLGGLLGLKPRPFKARNRLW